MSTRLLFIFSFVYTAAVILFAWYWGEHFTNYVHYKGDESWVCLEFNVLAAFILFLAVTIANGRLRGLLLLLIPFAIVAGAFVLGFVMMLATGAPGYPEEIIRFYSGAYWFLSIFTLVLVAGKPKKKRLSS